MDQTSFWASGEAKTPGDTAGLQTSWKDLLSTRSGVLAKLEGLRAEKIIGKIEEREKTGSTFLNEGIALPHARIDALEHPEIVLGLTHDGVLDSPTEKPIEVVFLLLSPASGPAAHLQLLAKAGRLLQSRELRRRLRKLTKPAEVLSELREWERAGN